MSNGTSATIGPAMSGSIGPGIAGQLNHIPTTVRPLIYNIEADIPQPLYMRAVVSRAFRYNGFTYFITFDTLENPALVFHRTNILGHFIIKYAPNSKFAKNRTIQLTSVSEFAIPFRGNFSLEAKIGMAHKRAEELIDSVYIDLQRISFIKKSLNGPKKNLMAISGVENLNIDGPVEPQVNPNVWSNLNNPYPAQYKMPAQPQPNQQYIYKTITTDHTGDDPSVNINIV